jgi:hypothetical protein
MAFIILEYVFLSYNIVYFGESPTLRRNISLLSSSSKSNSSIKAGEVGNQLNLTESGLY